MKQFINQPITLTTELGKGGEATVYNVAQFPDKVAKVYHHPTSAHEAKLRAMLVNPPEQSQRQMAITWPTALLYQQGSDLLMSVTPNQLETMNRKNVDLKRFVGFIMPKVTGSISIFEVYNPVIRRALPFPFTWQALLRTAYNLCMMVKAIHAKGYVIGDLNESNILVNQQAVITVVDTDSFQVIEEQGTIHRCKVGKGEYTPPELQGIDFKTIDQTPAHDLFGLGVMLFQLLMEGFHPFAGVLQSKKSVGRVDLYAIRAGLFPYDKIPAMKPPPSAPPYHLLQPELQHLFQRCFVTAYKQPTLRPTAEQWGITLAQAEQHLTICSNAPTHIYGNHLEACPWCVLEKHRFQQVVLLDDDIVLVKTIKLFAQAVKAYQTNDYSRLINLTSQIIKEKSTLSEAFTLRAWAYWQQQQFHAAHHDCQQAIELTQNQPLAYYLLGLYYLQQKQDYQKAIEAFNEAILIGYQPAAELQEQISEISKQEKGDSMVIQTELLKSAPHKPVTPFPNIQLTTLFDLGVTAYEAGQVEATNLAMETLDEFGDSSAEIYSYLAWAGYQKKHYSQALVDFDIAREEGVQQLIPDLDALLFEVGEQAYQQNQSHIVSSIMKGLIEIDQPDYPTPPEVYFYRAWAYYKVKNYHQAIVTYNKGLDRAEYDNQYGTILVNDLPEPNVVALIFESLEQAYDDEDINQVEMLLQLFEHSLIIPPACRVYQAWVDYQHHDYQQALSASQNFVSLVKVEAEQYRVDYMYLLDMAKQIIADCEHNLPSDVAQAIEEEHEQTSGISGLHFLLFLFVVFILMFMSM